MIRGSESTEVDFDRRHQREFHLPVKVYSDTAWRISTIIAPIPRHRGHCFTFRVVKQGLHFIEIGRARGKRWQRRTKRWWRARWEKFIAAIANRTPIKEAGDRGDKWNYTVRDRRRGPISTWGTVERTTGDRGVFFSSTVNCSAVAVPRECRRAGSPEQGGKNNIRPIKRLSVWQ